MRPLTRTALVSVGLSVFAASVPGQAVSKDPAPPWVGNARLAAPGGPAEWIPTFGGVSGTDYRVTAIEVIDGDDGPIVYAGGDFIVAGRVVANHVACWTERRWQRLGAGVDGAVRALELFDDGTGPALYVGGQFWKAGGVPAAYVARWDGATWSPVGTGFGGASPHALALAEYDDGSGPALFVGGTFTNAGGVSAARVAKWDGTSWSAAGSGVGDSFGQVVGLATYDDGAGDALYVTGSFTSAGGTPAANLARWDGTSWTPAGSGVDSSASSLAAGGGRLFVGGSFSDAGRAAVTGIASFDGSTWSALGKGFNDSVFGLAVFDDGSGPALHACGSFTGWSGEPRDPVLKWDGTRWLPVGGPLDGPAASSLAVHDDGSGPALYVAGTLTAADGVPAANVARWDGAAWSPVGLGLDGFVYALEVHDDGTGPALYAGGSFGASGSVPTPWIPGGPLRVLAS